MSIDMQRNPCIIQTGVEPGKNGPAPVKLILNLISVFEFTQNLKTVSISAGNITEPNFATPNMVLSGKSCTYGNFE